MAGFDGSASADADGTIAGYAWDFGDGTARQWGDTVAHVRGGRHVHGDADGDRRRRRDRHRSRTRSPCEPANTGPAVLADDTFDRTVSGGLGTAPVGGPWTAAVGATRQSVGSGIATMTLPAANNNTGSYLGGISQTDVNVLTSFSVSSMPTGNGTYVYATGRRVGANEYRVRARLLPNGTVALALSRLSGGEAFPGGETVLPGLTFTAGTQLSMRMQVSGTAPTAITATVWRTGTTEPAAPQRTWTDTTAALQAAGAVGLAVHRPSNTTAVTEVRFADFRVTGAGGGGTPANTPPSPSFTATPSDLSVGVDASASADPDGSIASYSWNWGDGTATGSGRTANHTYATAGQKDDRADGD